MKLSIILFTKFKAIEDQFDFVLVEGSDFSTEGNIIEWDTNVLIAKNWEFPAILITSGKDKTVEEAVSNLYMAYDSFKDKRCWSFNGSCQQSSADNRERVND